jgi:uncharacterized protein with GYD domain
MGRGECVMLFIALAKFKKKLSKEIVAENLKDIEDDTKGQVRYLGIYWTLGRYDTVVLFEAPNEKVAMNLALKRADRMDIEIFVAVPAEERSPSGPA